MNTERKREDGVGFGISSISGLYLNFFTASRMNSGINRNIDSWKKPRTYDDKKIDGFVFCNRYVRIAELSNTISMENMDSALRYPPKVCRNAERMASMIFIIYGINYSSALNILIRSLCSNCRHEPEIAPMFLKFSLASCKVM